MSKSLSLREIADSTKRESAPPANMNFGYGWVAMGNTMFAMEGRPGGSLSVALAQVALHEAGHFLIPTVDEYHNWGIINPNDVGTDLGQLNQLTFNWSDVHWLKSKCKKLRSTSARGAGGGGGGIGPWDEFDALDPNLMGVSPEAASQSNDNGKSEGLNSMVTSVISY